jgi:hypothetical protein
VEPCTYGNGEIAMGRGLLKSGAIAIRLIPVERESPVRKAAMWWAPHVGRRKKGKEHPGIRTREVFFVSTVTCELAFALC